MTADMFPYLYGYNAQLWHNFILVHLPSEVKATILPRTQVSSRFGRTECHSFKFIRWVVVGARFESPRNTGEQKKRKKRRFTMLGQTSSNLIILMSRVPNQIILIIFCLQKMVDLKICPTCPYPTSNTAILLFHPPQQFFGEQNEKINDRLKREHARALFFPTRQKHNVMK